MARPIKTGLAYFPLDTDFFTNKKINNLRRAHGSIGVLTYLNLLCRVYSNGYYYRFDDINELAMDIAEEIANSQIRATATRVTETINYLVGRGILDEGLFKQGIISGEALQEQYVMIAYKAKRKIEMGVHSLVDAWEVVSKNKVFSEETIVCSEETQVSSEFGTQSKSKSKSKREDIPPIAPPQEGRRSRRRKTEERHLGNFDTDEFFQRAMERSYGKEWAERRMIDEQRKKGEGK